MPTRHQEAEDRKQELVSATTTRSAVPGLVAINPDPPAFRQARRILAVEAVLLLVLGIWAAVAAGVHQGAAPPDGVPVLWFRFTMIHAVVIIATGVLAALATLNRRFALGFSVAQTVGYLFVFIISAGNLNTFSDAADSILHGVLAALGLVLLMWIAARALDGSGWARTSRRES